MVGEEDGVKATNQKLPAEERSKVVPIRVEDTHMPTGQPDEREGAMATQQDMTSEQNQKTVPTIAEPLVGRDNTACTSPPLVDSLPHTNLDKETSPSAADGLRGEMDLAFGDHGQLDDPEQQHRLSGTSHKLSANSPVVPDVEENTATGVSAPQSPTVLVDHSRNASGPNGPEIFIDQPSDLEKVLETSQRDKNPRPWDVAHDESTEYTRPSSMGSDLYGAPTRSASPESANRVVDIRASSDAPTTSEVAAIVTEAQESTAQAPSDVLESEDSTSKRSSAVSNYLATTTVYEELKSDSKPNSGPNDINVLLISDDLSRSSTNEVSPSGLGFEPRTLQESSPSEVIRQNSAKSVLSPTKTASPPPPRRRAPKPPMPPTLTPVLSSPSSQLPATPTSATTASDLSSLSSPSQRDSSTFNTASTVSSEFPEVNTAASIQYSNTTTAATSLDIAATASVREQGQIRLRSLQSELAAAKARGDSKSQEDAIQRSIEVIWRSYLTPPTEPLAETSSPVTKSQNPKLKNRASILRLPSMGPSSKAISLGNAAAAGNVAKIATLLEEKANVNSTSIESKTPLMRAAINGHIKCLEVLKAFGADELAVDKAGSTALHHAVVSNNIAAVKWLLDSYPPPRPDVLRHRSSILLRATDAAKWGRTQKNLREASDTTGSKPLHVAVEKDLGGVVKILLAAGVDIEAKNNHGRTPLHQAIITSRRDSFDTLLRNGARIDALDGGSLSPLHWAARCGQILMIETLLGKGAARWDFDYAGNLPIHQAAWEGQLPALEALLTERADLDRVTKFGETLLHISALRNHQNVAEYLLRNMVDINPWAARDALWSHGPYAKLIGSSLTPLHYACCFGHFEIAYLLLDKEAYVNAPTPDGYTPLMMAVETGNTDMVSLLHNRGAKVNASLPGTMMTALHMASKRGDMDSVRELCRAGADWKARAGKEPYGKTPAQEADLCTDKVKRQEVRDYFATIRTNDYNKRRYNSAVEVNARATRAALAPAPQPVNYAPWGQLSNYAAQPSPIQTYPIQHTQSAPASQWTNGGAYMDELMRPPAGHPQYFDPTAYETQVDSPPPYQPGTSMSARLASQPPVHRPKYS